MPLIEVTNSRCLYGFQYKFANYFNLLIIITILKWSIRFIKVPMSTQTNCILTTVSSLAPIR